MRHNRKRFSRLRSDCSNELGLGPDIEETKLSGGAKQLFKQFVHADWPSIFRIKLSNPQIKEIQSYLHGFLTYHLDRIPSGRADAIPSE